MFGAFTDFLETATQKAKELSEAGVDLVQSTGYLQLEKGYNVEEETASGPAAAAVSTVVPQHNGGRGHRRIGSTNSDAASQSPHRSNSATEADLHWEHVATYVPPQFQAYAGEWQEFISGVVAEENSYCVPLTVFVDDASVMARLHAICGINADQLAKIVDDVAAHEMDAKAMVDVLERFPAAGQVRFHVVPKYVVEDRFWKNLLARCRVYHQCPSITAVLDTMDLLHKEPRLESGAPRKNGFGSASNAATLQEIRDKVCARQILSQWFDSKRNAARSELQTALGSLQLLQNLVGKREVSELSDSVRESCKYRKTKITALLGELQTVSHKLVDTELDVEHGELFLDLVKLNSQLQDALQNYQRLKESEGNNGDGTAATVGAAALVRPSSGLATPNAEHNSSPRDTSSTSWTNVSKPTSVASTSKVDPTGDGAGESAFTAELPWEDEDD